jgi:hypothetical protein
MIMTMIMIMIMIMIISHMMIRMKTCGYYWMDTQENLLTKFKIHFEFQL